MPNWTSLSLIFYVSKFTVWQFDKSMMTMTQTHVILDVMTSLLGTECRLPIEVKNSCFPGRQCLYILLWLLKVKKNGVSRCVSNFIGNERSFTRQNILRFEWSSGYPQVPNKLMPGRGQRISDTWFKNKYKLFVSRFFDKFYLKVFMV